jgi:hypothetical protein
MLTGPFVPEGRHFHAYSGAVQHSTVQDCGCAAVPVVERSYGTSLAQGRNNGSWARVRCGSATVLRQSIFKPDSLILTLQLRVMKILSLDALTRPPGGRLMTVSAWNRAPERLLLRGVVHGIDRSEVESVGQSTGDLH